jgi:AraC-like DNA-binding protein
MESQAAATRACGGVFRLYQRGLTIDEVVDQVGYSFSTVRRMLHANGVAVRVRGVGKREDSGERA